MPNIGPAELLVILLWIIPTFLVAKYAERKGHSFPLFLIIGLFVSFLLAWILAVVIPAPRGRDAARLS